MAGRTQGNLIPFGERLQTLREDRGYSQEKLGEAIGMSRESVGKLERGQSAPKYETIIKLCDILKAEPNDFFPSKYQKDTVDERMIRLQSRLALLSEAELNQFYMMAEGNLDVIQKPGWTK